MSSEVLSPGALAGWRVVVTGSSAGLGRAIAARALALGAVVEGVDLAEATLHGERFHATTLDLSDGAATEAAARTLSSADALVHSAGMMSAAPLGAIDAAAGERMWRVHVDAITRLANAMVPEMASRGRGRVVLVASRVAQGMPGRSQYAAVKSAQIALVRSWAAEVASRGVTVNAVSPTATATAMLADPARAGSPPRIPPLGRLIEPAEVAELVSFLLSPAAAAITGQNIPLCGGASLPA